MTESASPLRSGATVSDDGAGSKYDRQAELFLARHGLTFKAGDPSDGKCPVWAERPAVRGSSLGCANCGAVHGYHYRPRIHGSDPENTARRRSITFDFWGSKADADSGRELTAYSVLSCIGSDLYTPETFEDFCSEYGYDPDSRNAERLFNRADRFACRLRAFFTEAEQAELAEIQ